MIGLGQTAIGLNQQVFQAFLPSGDIAELPDLIADEFLLAFARERSD